MSTLLIISSTHWIPNFLAQLDRGLDEVRSNSAVLKILLWPLHYALVLAKVLSNYLISGVSQAVNHSIPWTIMYVRNHIMTSTPNSVYWFNKTKFLLFFADMYFFVFYFFKIGASKELGYIYCLTKLLMIVLPFMTLSPVARLPFWVIGFGLTIAEIFVGLWMITSWGYGIDWERDHFYNHWKKHYRYRYASGNRQVTVELCQWVYPVLKLLIFIDYFSQSTPAESNLTVKPTMVTKGSLDLDYLTALLEQDTVANLRYGILFLLALSSLGVYSIILAGWSSNSKYAFIGALRSAAQMISYEVAISLIILPVVLLAGSLNLTMITYIQNITVWFLWPLLPVSILFLIAMLAETNRTPFDLPEAEAELVAGYNVDYSSLPFAMFFLGEYCNMILISTLYCILFLAGGLNSLGLSSALVLSCKAALTWVFFVLVRATLPRYRYDQLMDIGWKVFLPIAGAFLLLVFGVLVYFDALPVANELPLVGTTAFPSCPLVLLLGQRIAAYTKSQHITLLAVLCAGRNRRAGGVSQFAPTQLITLFSVSAFLPSRQVYFKKACLQPSKIFYRP